MTFMNANAATNWDRLDSELARWLRLRATRRAARNREASPLDATAFALRRVRATLDFIVSHVVHDTPDDAAVVDLASRTYRWAIRIARELEAIEQLDVDPMTDWSRFEAFAPFALAFFDSALAAPFAAAPATVEVARLRREIDDILAPLATAMATSATAA
jgi:hypothetical protein